MAGKEYVMHNEIELSMPTDNSHGSEKAGGLDPIAEKVLMHYGQTLTSLNSAMSKMIQYTHTHQEREIMAIEHINERIKDLETRINGAIEALNQLHNDFSKVIENQSDRIFILENIITSVIMIDKKTTETDKSRL